MCSSSGGSAPDPNPGMIFQARVQSQIGNRYLDMQDQLMDYYMERQKHVDSVSEEVTRRSLEMAEETQAQGRDLYEYQKNVFRPVEQSLVDEAMRDSTPEAYERFAQEAVTQQALANANAQGQADRALAGMGVNPNSGAYAANKRGLQLANAAGLGATANNARDQAENLSWARRADAAGLGKGLVGAGNASYGLAQGSNTAATNAANAASQVAGSTVGTPTQYGALGVQAHANSANTYGDIYKTQMQGWAASQQNSGGGLFGSALGTGLGYWASTGFAT